MYCNQVEQRTHAISEFTMAQQLNFVNNIALLSRTMVFNDFEASSTYRWTMKDKTSNTGVKNCKVMRRKEQEWIEIYASGKVLLISQKICVI